MAYNEFDYVTFRRKAECVRSAMRCVLSKSSKIARIRTSEAKSARTEHRRRPAPRSGAHNLKLCDGQPRSGSGRSKPQFFGCVNGLNISGKLSPCFLKIIENLKVEPKFRRDSKEFPKLERCFSRNTSLASYNLANTSLGKSGFLGKTISRNS